PARPLERDRLDVVGDARPLPRGRAQNFEAEPGVIHLRIVISRPAAQPLLAQLGKLLPQAPEVERSMAMQVAPSGEQVVERQAEPPFPRCHAGTGVEGEDEPEWVDEVRRVVEQDAALVQGLVDQAKIAMLQVAKAAVDELGRDAAGAGSKIPLVEESNAEA